MGGEAGGQLMTSEIGQKIANLKGGEKASRRSPARLLARPDRWYGRWYGRWYKKYASKKSQYGWRLAEGVDQPAAKDFSHFSDLYQPVASQRLGTEVFGDLGNCKACEHFLIHPWHKKGSCNS